MWRHSQLPAVPVHLLSWCICPLQKEAAQFRNNLSLKSCCCFICILGISILTRLTYCTEKGALRWPRFLEMPSPIFCAIAATAGQGRTCHRETPKVSDILKGDFKGLGLLLFFFFNGVGNHYQFKYNDVQVHLLQSSTPRGTTIQGCPSPALRNGTVFACNLWASSVIFKS